MITEDYVSFEVAKLLKEKRFDEPIKSFYFINGTFVDDAHITKNSYTRHYAAPTLQMALKWLRDTHRLVVNVAYIDFLEHGEVWAYEIIQRDTFEIKHKKSENLHTYEDAAEAAIKYCLTNLI